MLIFPLTYLATPSHYVEGQLQRRFRGGQFIDAPTPHFTHNAFSTFYRLASYTLIKLVGLIDKGHHYNSQIFCKSDNFRMSDAQKALFYRPDEIIETMIGLKDNNHHRFYTVLKFGWPATQR